ncbi:sulfite exporter TauE/SafE family protein [uncultured Sphaerochaeta sp.]|uniref:sulfite exporter TauE/SafE family protein n=1 Tax=uncultured Sphaerochaeta sp. TaxID=886478 RepID=UPI002A0A48DF|nr:sulfite exporter TauE/SafE family protein [uncultured Sphaerochaeta sp.]
MYISVILFTVVFIGAFLQSNIGFGFPIIVMIVLPSLFPFSTAVTLCQVIAMASTGFLTILYWKHIQWKTLLPLLGTSMLIAAFVTVYSLSVAPGNLTLILGFCLLALSLFFVVFSKKITIKPRIRNGLLMGTLAGFGNGLFGIGGPPVALYLLPSVHEKIEYLATIQAYFFFCNLESIGIRVFNGALVLKDIPLILIGWGGILIGTKLGLKSFNKIPEDLLKKIVYLFVGVSGLLIAIGELIKR